MKAGGLERRVICSPNLVRLPGMDGSMWNGADSPWPEWTSFADFCLLCSQHLLLQSPVLGMGRGCQSAWHPEKGRSREALQRDCLILHQTPFTLWPVHQVLGNRDWAWLGIFSSRLEGVSSIQMQWAMERKGVGQGGLIGRLGTPWKTNRTRLQTVK